MAAPVASYVQLPSDASNTGKKNRTHTKAVGSDTVHEHFVVPSPGYTRTGRYCWQSSANVVVATSGTTVAALAMTTSATYRAVLRSIDVSWGQSGETIVTETAPVYFIQKATYGTAISATTLATVLSFQSSSTTAQLRPFIGSSGASVGTPVPFAAFTVPCQNSTAGTYGGYANVWRSQDQFDAGTGLEMKAGDVIQVFQHTAGTASDVRTITLRFEWDEMDVS
jgi:hypothetical protein